ncbi:MAG TPA: thiolase family protein [Tepidisphaeraceae bacterium]|jgi:acetyl-CoA C-acetyltransferase/acetyl-CoA acyltransferase
MVAWNSDADVAIIAGARTPWAKAGTALKDVHVTDLASAAMQETLYRAEVRGDDVDEVILGNVVMPPDAGNPARVAAIWAAIPEEKPAMTVQRNCASGIEAVAEAAGRIRAGQAKCVLAGGAESMSTIPLLFPQESMAPFARLSRAKNAWQKAAAAAALRPRHFAPRSALESGLTDPTCDMIMGKTAELLASEFGIGRAEQDEFALRSHRLAAAAQQAGKPGVEIAPLYVGDGSEPVTEDNGVRANQTSEALAKLKPIFDRRDGTVTVGNSCQITDGAAAMVVMEGERARAEGREVMGYVRGYAYVGLDPARMGLGPVFAIDQLLREAGMGLSDIGLFEINEAFAAQVLACLKAMSSSRFACEHLNRKDAIGEIDLEKLNVNGGSIALGHPVGATGTRLVLTLLAEMKRRDVEWGVAALCVGGGQGAAMLLQRR